MKKMLIVMLAIVSLVLVSGCGSAFVEKWMPAYQSGKTSVLDGKVYNSGVPYFDSTADEDALKNDSLWDKGGSK